MTDTVKICSIKIENHLEKVYVNPDLTRSEHEAQKLLRDELKSVKIKEKHLIIRGNKIVKRRGNKNVGQLSGSSHTIASPRLSSQPQSDQPMESDENNTSS